MVAVAPFPVLPRAISPITGDNVPLLEIVQEFCETHTVGGLMIVGAEGTGKTTALSYLEAALPGAYDVEWLDQPPLKLASAVSLFRRVVFTSTPTDFDGLCVRLAPWTRDELIEFLLAECPDRCESVMRRIGNEECNDSLLPIFWSTVLRVLAADEGVRDVGSAIRQHILQSVSDPQSLQCIKDYSLAHELAGWPLPGDWPLIQERLPHDTLSIVRIRPVRLMLAAKAVEERLSKGNAEVLKLPWPSFLLEYVSEKLLGQPEYLNTLRAALRGHTRGHATAASLMVRANNCWVPDRKLHQNTLGGADLRGVDWSGIDLTGFDLGATNLSNAVLAKVKLVKSILSVANLSGARLPGADLSNVRAEATNLSQAVLDECRAEGARFRESNLQGARAHRANMSSASFWSANLSQAEFHGSSFRNARLMGVDLSDSDFGNCDLSDANLLTLDLRTIELSGSRLHRTSLNHINMEDVVWSNVDFTSAVLYQAHCTGSRLASATMEDADLREAELGEIDWEGVNLQNADLRGATFHLGSSRSGLVFSPFASEGSRTGFYTDESLEQHFQTPEEIRKANLCRADLRGANIEGVDFYLVDLRGALLDPEQLAWLRQSGAILDAD